MLDLWHENMRMVDMLDALPDDELRRVTTRMHVCI